MAPRNPNRTAVETDRAPDRGPATNEEREQQDAAIAEYFNLGVLAQDAYHVHVARAKLYEVIPIGTTDLSCTDFQDLTPSICRTYTTEQLAFQSWGAADYRRQGR